MAKVLTAEDVQRYRLWNRSQPPKVLLGEANWPDIIARLLDSHEELRRRLTEACEYIRNPEGYARNRKSEVSPAFGNSTPIHCPNCGAIGVHVCLGSRTAVFPICRCKEYSPLLDDPGHVHIPITSCGG